MPTPIEQPSIICPEPPLGFLNAEQANFVREAYEETLSRYDSDSVEHALGFFIGALGLLQVKPDAESIAWATAELKSRNDTDF